MLPAMLALLLADVSPAVDCDALLARHREAALALSYELFDQTENSGMRVLAQAGCDAQAADLIEAYISRHGSSEASLTWHVAQLRASAGDYASAIRHARKVLRENEDYAVNPLRWNDYVLATIAFLERNRTALIRHRDRVAESTRVPEAYFGNQLNLKLLDALIRHFDRDYAYATTHIEP